MDRFYAKYLEDLPPGTALPTDDVKSQYPDMAGGQVVLPWTLYEQYGDRATLAAALPGDEGLRRPQRDREAQPHLARQRGLRRLVPADPRRRGQRRDGRARTPATASARSRSSTPRCPTTRPTPPPRRRRRSATPTTRRTSATIADAIKDAFNAPLPQRRGRRLRQRPPDDEHPPAGLRHGPGAEPAGGRRPARPEHPRRQRRPSRHRHLRHALHRRRARVDRPDRRGDDRARPGELPGLRVRARPRRDDAVGAVDLRRRHADPRPRDVRRDQRLAVHAARGHHAGESRLSHGEHRAAGAEQPRPRRREHRHGARHGRVRLDQSADSLRLEVTIPPNATATVRVPLGPGQGVSTPEGAERIGDGVFAVGSGQWTFITGKTAVDVPGTVGGSVPPTLSLALGAPASFGPFTPGVARTTRPRRPRP